MNLLRLQTSFPFQVELSYSGRRTVLAPRGVERGAEGSSQAVAPPSPLSLVAAAVVYACACLDGESFQFHFHFLNEYSFRVLFF